jgi:hypothetical protein
MIPVYPYTICKAQGQFNNIRAFMESIRSRQIDTGPRPEPAESIQEVHALFL